MGKIVEVQENGFAGGWKKARGKTACIDRAKKGGYT
jgi:hypothetical protein